MIWKAVTITLAASALWSCKAKPAVPEKLGYEMVSSVPHDPGAYTQGLQLSGGRLLESTGQYGSSTVRELKAETGEILRKRSLPAEVFGEGLTLHGKELWVLTWKEKTAYVLDPESFRTLRTHTYQGEGWGLTSDGGTLIMSDGSATLTFRNPKDLSVVRKLEVKDGGRPLKLLNELEYIKGQIFANIYTTDRIARIDPESGEVTGWLDFSALRAQLPAPNRAEVLNGIAYDEATGNLRITGKYWPRMFEVRLKGE
jgi:glutamine cyclotransferase